MVKHVHLARLYIEIQWKSSVVELAQTVYKMVGHIKHKKLLHHLKRSHPSDNTKCMKMWSHVNLCGITIGYWTTNFYCFKAKKSVFIVKNLR